MDVMDAVDGALDNVKNAMDNAIQRINREIRLQKLKSDSLCQLKTAHNWQKEKEENVVDVSAPNFFWRAHTVTVLLGNLQFIRTTQRPKNLGVVNHKSSY